MAQQQTGSTRRGFLRSAGVLAVGFQFFAPPTSAEEQQRQEPHAGLPADLRRSPKVDSWLRIGADGSVTLLVGKVELGQGILTAVCQICADELDVDMKRIRLISGDTALVPNEGTTAGSFSVVECGTSVRHAAAEARQQVLKLAATRLAVPTESLSVEDGSVSAGGKTVTYWELVKDLDLSFEVSGKVPFKATEKQRYIGKRIERIDIPRKVFGQEIFIQDLRPEGMLHGRVVHPPYHGAMLEAVDESEVEKMPGVVKVVRDGSFLGVVAKEEYQTVSAAKKLAEASKWIPADQAISEQTPLDQSSIYGWLVKQQVPPKAVLSKKPTEGTRPAAIYQQTYRRPYQLHGSIGPSTAIATAQADGTYLIQTHSQSVFDTGAAIAEMLGVDPSKVRCQHQQGSGCYGHNAADDVAAEAALLARAVPSHPIRIQWSRTDEHQWEPYGSAMEVRVAVGLDQKGNVLNWDLHLWSMPHGTRPSGRAGNLLPAHYLAKPFAMPEPRDAGPPNYAAARNAIALYEFPGQTVTTHFVTAMPLRASSMRGLGAYTNVFAIESFIDELATRAQADPVEYRLRYLKDERAIDVLRKAAAMYGWANREQSEGVGHGIAFARYKNLAAYAAIALEAHVDRASGVIKVVRVCAACDVGETVNPDGVANQIEGGILQSLSWTLKEAVKFQGGTIKTIDWRTYPILKFTDVPEVDVAILNRPDQPFLGTGEAAQGPTGAALANAVASACGTRLREIPFTPDRVKSALLNTQHV